MKKIYVALGVVVFGILLFAVFTTQKDSTGNPSRVAYENCTWKKESGAGLQIWAQQCDYGDRQVRVVASEAPLGFVEEIKDGNNDWATTGLAIQVFTLSSGQTINDLLPTVTIALSTYPIGASCAFELSNSYSVPGKKRYILAPTGKTKEAYELSSKTSTDIPSPPCGIFGINADSSSFFEVQDAHPTTILYVNTGQELPLFDETQITII